MPHFSKGNGEAIDKEPTKKQLCGLKMEGLTKEERGKHDNNDKSKRKHTQEKESAAHLLRTYQKFQGADGRRLSSVHVPHSKLLRELRHYLNGATAIHEQGGRGRGRIGREGGC